MANATLKLKPVYLARSYRIVNNQTNGTLSIFEELKIAGPKQSIVAVYVYLLFCPHPPSADSEQAINSRIASNRIGTLDGVNWC